MMAELQDYSLARSGRLPLKFTGEFLAGATGEDLLDEKSKNPRWHDLHLYKTKGGRYVLHVRYRTEYGDEVGHDEVVAMVSPDEVADVLARWNPTSPVRGYPKGVAQWQEKQDRMMGDIRARFARCVSDLFDQLGPEFAEEIE